ncbi:ArnT family glycosyltransferase [Tundrisphaera sp. TA3]|uniref:ArnT family glycosyltransferase n=1 Tax=Tundrisphaera sp. TA3 TaxID=3435775 RepID=UPI003EBA27FF
MGSIVVDDAGSPQTEPGPSAPARSGRIVLALLLVATFAIRALYPGQPIVENYVGRQIPTAMVARNLVRGSGFFRPELDTGPFPNLFLVEPPIYAQIVATTHLLTGIPLEPTGRLISAAATALAAWGLFGLARRREGTRVALLAVASFAIFPVMIRYGRAFQPDALMLGAMLGGLRCWDDWNSFGERAFGPMGLFFLALALGLKFIVAWALLPFVVIVGRWPMASRVAAAGLMLMPAFAWYLLQWGEVQRPGAGSLASSDNAAIWIRSVGPAAWLRLATWTSVGRALVWSSFGPAGFGLACWGWIAGGKVDPLWKAWGIGCGVALLVLAAKWHHGYYWMVVAPVAAVGVGRGLVALGRFGFVFPALMGTAFLGNCVAQSVGTWRTPPEWASLPEVVRALTDHATVDEMPIAAEAVLYFADRRGFRLEFEPEASRRAAGEWGGMLVDPANPLALTSFYQSQDWDKVPEVGQSIPDFVHGFYRPRWVADVGPAGTDGRRRAWRAAIREKPGTRLILDRPDAFVAEIR